MDCNLPGSSVHGIFQARVLEWGAIVFSREPPRNPLVQWCPAVLVRVGHPGLPGHRPHCTWPRRSHSWTAGRGTRVVGRPHSGGGGTHPTMHRSMLPSLPPGSSRPGSRSRGQELDTASNAHACTVDPRPGLHMPRSPFSLVPLSQMWRGPVTQAAGLSGRKAQWPGGWSRHPLVGLGASGLQPREGPGPPKPSGRASGPSQLTALAITTSSRGVSTPLPSTAPEALWLLFSGLAITNSYKQACTKLKNFLNTIKYLLFSK